MGSRFAWAGLAAGCATYRASDLPARPALAASVAALNRTRPNGSQISADRALTLAEIGLLAVQNSPDLKAIRARRGVAQAQVIQAGLLPDPVLSGSYGVLLAGPDFANAFSASLTGDIAALVTLSARRTAASKTAQQVDADVVWQEWQTYQQAQKLTIDIVEQGRLLRSLEQTLDLLQKRAATTAKGVAEGNATLQMLAPDASAVTSLQTQLDTAALAQERQWQSLDALLGLEPWVRPSLATEFRVPALSQGRNGGPTREPGVAPAGPDRAAARLRIAGSAAAGGGARAVSGSDTWSQLRQRHRTGADARPGDHGEPADFQPQSGRDCGAAGDPRAASRRLRRQARHRCRRRESVVGKRRAPPEAASRRPRRAWPSPHARRQRGKALCVVGCSMS